MLNAKWNDKIVGNTGRAGLKGREPPLGLAL